MRSSVTLAVKGPSGSFQVRSNEFTGAVSDSLPWSASRSTARAVTGLLSEAAWKSVCGVTAVFVETSATP